MLRDRIGAAVSAVTNSSGSNYRCPLVVDDEVTAFTSLREDDRKVLILAAWEGLTGRELAVALGCSDAAATTRLSRARSRLAASADAFDDSTKDQVGGGRVTPAL